VTHRVGGGLAPSSVGAGEGGEIEAFAAVKRGEQEKSYENKGFRRKTDVGRTLRGKTPP